MGKKIEQIVYSGLAEKSDNNEETVNCYLCKRLTGSKSIAIVDGKPASRELNLKKVMFHNQHEHIYLVCEECLMLLAHLTNSDKEVYVD